MKLNKTLSTLLIAACATGALAAPSFAANRAGAVNSQKSVAKNGSHRGKRATTVTSKSRGARKTHRGRSKAKTSPIGHQSA
jgi:Skp family chaperone for outer membrane proteins